jgi:hypothetical protein
MPHSLEGRCTRFILAHPQRNAAWIESVIRPLYDHLSFDPLRGSLSFHPVDELFHG